MRDESKTIYVGQRIGTILITEIRLYTRTAPYQCSIELVVSAEVISDEDRVSFSYVCDCRLKEQHVSLSYFLKCTKVYTFCPKCNASILWEDMNYNRVKRRLKKELDLAEKRAKLPRIISLPKHILAANKIYRPGIEGCHKLLEMFPTMPDGWAIRKLDKASPTTVANLFVINTIWAENKYKECKIIEDNFEPSCNAEYLGKGQYHARCNSCGKIHKISYSNIYSHHDTIHKNTPTKRRCKCLVKIPTPKIAKLTFEERFKRNNHYHEFIGLVDPKKRNQKQRMRLKHITCGKSYEAVYGNSKRLDTCPCCANYFTDFSRPMLLYYVRINVEPVLYKLGITQRNVRERFSKDPVYLITELKTWRFKVGQDAFNEEHRLLAQYKEFAYNGAKFLKSEGHTEILTKDVLGLDK